MTINLTTEVELQKMVRDVAWAWGERVAELLDMDDSDIERYRANKVLTLCSLHVERALCSFQLPALLLSMNPTPVPVLRAAPGPISAPSDI